MQPDFKELSIGGSLYIIRKFKALQGLEFQKHIYECGLFSEENGVNVMAIEPEVMRDMIVACVALGGVNFTNEKFDTHFSGKYMEVFELVSEILIFNFFPNVESDSEEK